MGILFRYHSPGQSFTCLSSLLLFSMAPDLCVWNFKILGSSSSTQMKNKCIFSECEWERMIYVEQEKQLRHPITMDSVTTPMLRPLHTLAFCKNQPLTFLFVSIFFFCKNMLASYCHFRAESKVLPLFALLQQWPLFHLPAMLLALTHLIHSD